MSNTLREFQEDEIKEVQMKEEIKEREAQGKSKGVGKGKEDKGKEGKEGNSKEGEAPGSEQSQSSQGGSADFEHDEQPELAEILADDEFQRTRARVASGLQQLGARVCGIDGCRRPAMKTCSYCKGNARGKHTRVRSMFRECVVCESTPLQCENGLNLGPTEAD